ncbi:MAG: iron-containing redox enzyme family protein [Nitrospirae bacterium]|nr:iron-containing redox enzyme family protein [Nitrospirota bacterium]
MPTSSTRPSALQFLEALERELQALPVHTNPFFLAFQRGVSWEQLHRFVKQWYTFGIRFRKILIGLLYNLSDQDEAIGLELMRVLYSEYGQGVLENVHATQMLRLVERLGIDRRLLVQERLCPEAQDYIDTVGEIFLRGDLPSALGASFGIESTAGLAYRYLYSGLLTFPELSLADIRFFETHLFEELHHGDWLRTAVAGYADLDEQRDRIRASALLAMEKWHGLWQGMHRVVLDAASRPAKS